MQAAARHGIRVPVHGGVAADGKAEQAAGFQKLDVKRA
jgi:hypothetical protein